MKGHASIVSFPFRIYSEAFLPLLEGKAGQHRLRVHPPFRVRELGSPLSPEVPFSQWTAFEWSPALESNKRLQPPRGLNTSPMGERAFDALRLDVWGPRAEVYGQEFVGRFLRWIRRLTEQPWIAAFESQTDPLIKATFQIDGKGRASDTPYAYGVVQSSDGFRHALTKGEWTQAFQRAVEGVEPPLYWLLYLDAQNLLSEQRRDAAILSLALSLEVARNTLLEKSVAFEGTDLTKHLGVQLQRGMGRSLHAELPDVYRGIEDLYVARHHVAHGRPPIVRLSGGTRPASGADAGFWSRFTRSALVWMEGVVEVNEQRHQ